MDKKRSIIRAGAVLAVALAAGHLVQTMNVGGGDSAEAAAKPTKVETVSAGDQAEKAKDTAMADTGLPAAASLTADPEAPVLPAAAGLIPVEPGAPETVETAALTEDPVMPALPAIDPPVAPTAPVADAAPAPALADDAAPAIPQAEPAAPAALADCTPVLSLTAGAQAMISVTLSAPCHAGQRVVLRHAGLAVAEQLDGAGQLVLDLPALKSTGEVSVLFANADIARDAVPVPDADKTQRFAVQWMADDAFQLHVLEGAASYGEPGHVWADAPVSANGGYLQSLGNPTLDLPMMAQVYTWPANASLPAAVSVESEVTQATCARELLGETILSQAGKVTITDLTLAMPECDALGDILVLNNLAPDVTLAAAN